MIYNQQISPLACDHFDYDESTKNLHFKRRQKMNDTTELPAQTLPMEKPVKKQEFIDIMMRAVQIGFVE